jgi:hypothetical protein
VMTMFMVSEEGAAAVRAAFDQGGELSATIELRRLFPGITDQAREGARPRPPLSARRRRSERNRCVLWRSQHLLQMHQRYSPSPRRRPWWGHLAPPGGRDDSDRRRYQDAVRCVFVVYYADLPVKYRPGRRLCRGADRTLPPAWVPASRYRPARPAGGDGRRSARLRCPGQCTFP